MYTYGHLRLRYVFVRVLLVYAGAVWRGCACVHVCGPDGARRRSLSRQHPSVSRTYPQVRALSKKKKYTWYIYKKVHIVYKKKVRKNVHIAWATPAGGVATARHTEVCMYVLRATNTRRSTSIRTWVCRALIRWCFSTLSLYHCACRTLIRRRSLYLLYWYKSTRTTMCVLILPRTAIYVSSYYYICVLILLYMCPHTTICVLILPYMCPHTTIYVSSYYYICVLILLHVSSYYYYVYI